MLQYIQFTPSSNICRGAKENNIMSLTDLDHMVLTIIPDATIDGAPTDPKILVLIKNIISFETSTTEYFYEVGADKVKRRKFATVVFLKHGDGIRKIYVIEQIDIIKNSIRGYE
jgi:hypothetical protein